MKKAYKEKMCDNNYCIVIPFENESDFKQAIDKIQNTREKIQNGFKKKWYADGMIIDKKDYKKLLKKSKSIEIINELEVEDVEDDR